MVGAIQPAAAARFQDRQHAAAAARHAHQPGHLRYPASADYDEHGRERAQCLLGLRVRRAVDRRRATVAAAGRRAAAEQSDQGRNRDDGPDRRRAGAVAGRDAEAGSRHSRRYAPHRRDRLEAAHRQRHGGPVMDSDDRARRSPRFPPGADRPVLRDAEGPVDQDRCAAGAEESRSQRHYATPAQQPEAAAGRPADAIRDDRRRRHALHHRRGQLRQSLPGHRHAPRRLFRRAGHAVSQQAADMEHGAEYQLQPRHQHRRCIDRAGAYSAEPDRGTAPAARPAGDERRQQRRDHGTERRRARAGGPGLARPDAAAARCREQQVRRRHVDQLSGGPGAARSGERPEPRTAGGARLPQGGRRLRAGAADRRGRQHHLISR